MAVLRRHRLLVCFPEAVDGITRLIAPICRAPMAVINFIDEGRHWFTEIGLVDALHRLCATSLFSAIADHSAYVSSLYPSALPG